MFVGCGSEKVESRVAAKDLYTGTLFKKCRAYAEKVGDEWAILSAKHFLLLPDLPVDPYEKKFPTDKDYVRQWIKNTNWFIRSNWELWKKPARLICLAGAKYVQAFNSPILLPQERLKVELPLEGMGIGHRMWWLTEAVRCA